MYQPMWLMVMACLTLGLRDLKLGITYNKTQSNLVNVGTPVQGGEGGGGEITYYTNRTCFIIQQNYCNPRKFKRTLYPWFSEPDNFNNDNFNNDNFNNDNFNNDNFNNANFNNVNFFIIAMQSIHTRSNNSSDFQNHVTISK